MNRFCNIFLIVTVWFGFQGFVHSEITHEEARLILKELALEKDISIEKAAELLGDAIKAFEVPIDMRSQKDQYREFYLDVREEILHLKERTGEPLKKVAGTYLKQKEAEPLESTLHEDYKVAVSDIISNYLNDSGSSGVVIRIGESATSKGLKKSATLNLIEEDSEGDWHLKGGVALVFPAKTFEDSDWEYEPYFGISVDISDNEELSTNSFKASLGSLIYKDKVIDSAITFESNRRFTKRNLLGSGLFWFGDELESIADVFGESVFLDMGVGFEYGQVISDELPSEIEEGAFARGVLQLEYIYFPKTGVEQIDNNLSFSITNTLRYLSDDDWSSYNLLETKLEYRLSKQTTLNLSYTNGKNAPEFVQEDKLTFGLGYKQ